MSKIMIGNLPRCPKCKRGNLLPLSGSRTVYNGDDFAIPIAYWKCSNCKKEINGEREYDD